MKTSTTSAALATVSHVAAPSNNEAAGLAMLDQIEKYSRAELQEHAAAALAAIGLAPELMKTTRAVRALLRLAAVLEDASGHDREEFLEYAGKAWDRQGLPQGRKVKPSFAGAGSSPALGAKSAGMGMGASKQAVKAFK